MELQTDGVDADESAARLATFVDELRDLIGAFEIARACLRYAYQETQRGNHFSSAGVRGLDRYQDLLRVVGGDVSTALTGDVVNLLADIVSSSQYPSLAAWCIADALSVAIGQDFAAHLEAPGGASEYELQHLDAYYLYPGACHDLYGADAPFSERAGVDRDPANPVRVSGLALWIQPATGRGPYRVVVDKAGGDAFNAGLSADGLEIALVQPNRHLRELNVDWLSKKDDNDCRFFGIAPTDVVKQKAIVEDGITKARQSGAAIVLFPELVTTEGGAADAAKFWHGSTASAPHLHVVVAGSFHHESATGRRNTAHVYFRDFVNDVAVREHRKSGEFIFPMTRPALSALLDGDASKGPAAEKDLAWTVGKKFREDIALEREIRLYPGTHFSTVVVICADFIDRGMQDVLRPLRVSLQLICNMTPKIDGFVNAAKGFVQSGQTTTLSVNNPAEWPALGGDVKVEGAVACMPVRPQRRNTETAHFGKDELVLLFNPRLRKFRSANQRTGLVQ